MTEKTDVKRLPSQFTDQSVLAWMEEHRTDLRQYAAGQGLLYSSLATGFLVGLAAHVGGYLLLSSVHREPLGLLADLLHALGWSLWTGAVVAVFVQVIPEVKRRQINRSLDAYEALRRERTQDTTHHEGKV